MAISAASGVNNLFQSTNMAALGNTTRSSSPTDNLTRSTNNASGALQSLTQNENQFLTLLTTQLQHQDPTSPMDNQQLASELAQFSAVEQQVQTNKNLETLISLNENEQLSQSNQLIGKDATVATDKLPLQSGSTSLVFNQPRGQKIAISIADENGKIVKNDIITSDGHLQTWKWDGKDNDGNQLPDGAYNVAVMTADQAGNILSVPFLVHGTITGVVRGDDGLYVQMGDVLAPMSSVSSEQDPETSASDSGDVSNPPANDTGKDPGKAVNS